MPLELNTDRIGLELEVEDIQQNQIPVSNLFNITHDASCERHNIRYKKKMSSYLLKYNPNIRLLANSGREETLLMGGELVSKNPLYYSASNTGFDKDLDYQLGLLIAAGERPFSYRGSIHIHINFPIFEASDSVALKILKDAVRIGAHLEELFFHLGGMGYRYRGVVVNNSAYCRPITKKGPQVVLAEDHGSLRPVQIFVLEDLLKAESVKDFFVRIGNVPVQPGSVDRYNPARYTWLNLYGIMLHRTLEFRVFNKVLNTLLITAIIRLCQEVTKVILDGTLSNKELAVNSIYDSTGSNASHQILDDFIRIIGKPHYLTPKVIGLLHTILESSEITGKDFGKTYVYTHLRRYDARSDHYVYSTAGNYCPPLLNRNDIVNSDFIDIHNMYSRGR